MKQVTKSYICGVTCFPGGSYCNNYCNHDHSKEMPDNPLTDSEIIMEEKDMWENVIATVFHRDQTDEERIQLLSLKYDIKVKDK